MIAATLTSLRFQRLEPSIWEIIVIDNGSVDDTPLVLQSFRSTLNNLRVFYENEPGLHAGRHRGLTEAQGDVLVFADDDIEATVDWTWSILGNFRDPDLALLGGNSIPVFYGSVPVWLDALWSDVKVDGSRSLPMLSIQEHPPGRRGISPYSVWGCNFAIRKEILLAAGGFHPDGMPQELIRFRGDGETYVSRYVEENNLKCIFDSKASVYHKVTPDRMTIEYFQRRGFNQGVSDSYTRLREGPVDRSAQNEMLSLDPIGLSKKQMKKLKTFIAKKVRGKPLPLKSFEAGYRDGFTYHQNAYTTDPEVRKWVHKENYL